VCFFRCVVEADVHLVEGSGDLFVCPFKLEVLGGGVENGVQSVAHRAEHSPFCEGVKGRGLMNGLVGAPVPHLVSEQLADIRYGHELVALLDEVLGAEASPGFVRDGTDLEELAQPVLEYVLAVADRALGDVILLGHALLDLLKEVLGRGEVNVVACGVECGFWIVPGIPRNVVVHDAVHHLDRIQGVAYGGAMAVS